LHLIHAAGGRQDARDGLGVDDLSVHDALHHLPQRMRSP
jgi:hypothetical protein